MGCVGEKKVTSLQSVRSHRTYFAPLSPQGSAREMARALGLITTHTPYRKDPEQEFLDSVVKMLARRNFLFPGTSHLSYSSGREFQPKGDSCQNQFLSFQRDTGNCVPGRGVGGCGRAATRHARTDEHEQCNWQRGRCVQTERGIIAIHDDVTYRRQRWCERKRRNSPVPE